MFVRGLARKPQRRRAPISPKPCCASEPPSGQPAAIALQFRSRIEVWIFGTPGVPSGGSGLTLLVARETAIAAPGAEIAALDAVGIVAGHRGRRRYRNQQCEKCE